MQVYILGSEKKLLKSIIAASVEKRVSIFRVIIVNLSFGNLKFFKWSKILISYGECLIFLLSKKIFFKVKWGCYRNHHFKKDISIPSDINFQRMVFHQLQKFDFRDNFLEKFSPDAPKSFARGVGVLKSNKNKLLESSNILY